MGHNQHRENDSGESSEAIPRRLFYQRNQSLFKQDDLHKNAGSGESASTAESPTLPQSARLCPTLPDSVRQTPAVRSSVKSMAGTARRQSGDYRSLQAPITRDR
ncbi:hypothetical protein PoB_006625200 [Plakobranchus ocellatus]|uniref:Uncharacterized protein n=1 Tax=Plakobranchus ocellatus TaxID=259542 RepID=A0AAV4D6I1_9GAST|nr:hypothetical protein PoB_006625200 [Plakobranchus ocellatus]